MTDEYIKRTDALKALDWTWADDTSPSDKIKAIPPEDVVEVVRCCECVHHDDESHYCRKWRRNCPDDSDFFCKWGERKDGDGERKILRNEMD